MKRNADWWWDRTWNTVDGCDPTSPGCTNCYAAQIAGTKTWPVQHQNVTIKRGKRYIFNGQLNTLPFRHRLWSWPSRWAGSKDDDPALGVGMPSLIFVGDMADLFHELRPVEAIDRTVATIVASEHIGLLLTKRAHQTRGPDGGIFRRAGPAYNTTLAAETMVGVQWRGPRMVRSALERHEVVGGSRLVCLRFRRTNAKAGDATAGLPRIPATRLGHRRR